jgi:hypothetical protein
VFGRIKLALTILIGVALGLLSARYVAGGGLDLVAMSQGPWKTWPSAGLNTMDPYTKAHFLAEGRLADNRREIVEFETAGDGNGSPFDAGCTYLIAGRFGWSRWWSITASRESDHASLPPLRPSSLHSGQVVFEADGTAVIRLAADPQTGNWLAMPSSGRINLVLRYYDPVPASRANPAAVVLPQVQREACR